MWGVTPSRPSHSGGRCCSTNKQGCLIVLATVLVSLTALSTAAAAASADTPPAAATPAPAAVSCPIHYSRHSLEDIKSRAKTPYLFGGIYEDGRRCPNCRRGGLWSEFCGFSRSLDRFEQLSTFWRMQLCNASTVDAAIDRALAQDNAGDLLTMTPCDLWPYMRGRTTWVIGDSMSKDLFKALRCFMVEFQDLKTYHASNNFTAMHHLQSIPGQGEPHCAHMPDNTRLCQIHAIEGDLFVAADPDSDRTSVGGVLPLIQQHLALPDDLFVVHFGLWHGETRQDGYKKYLHELGRFYKSTREKFPHMFFMETPKQHFDSEDGDFKVPWIKTRKGPWTCQPIKGVTLNPDGTLTAAKPSASPSSDSEGGDGGVEGLQSVAEYVAQGSWRNQFAREILAQYDIPLIPIYNVTVPAWDFHRSNLQGQECSHFCHPSLPQFWLWSLLSVFKQQEVPPVANPSKQPLQAGCAVTFEWQEKRFGTPVPTVTMLEEQERQRSWWDWVFGRNKFVLKDGVLVPQPSTPSVRKDTDTTPTPWEGLVKLLDQLQHQQQGDSSSKKQQPQEDKQQQQQQPADKSQGVSGRTGRKPSPQPSSASPLSTASQQQQQPRVQQEKRRRDHQQQPPRQQQLEKGTRSQQQPRRQQWRPDAAPPQQQSQQVNTPEGVAEKHWRQKQQQQGDSQQSQQQQPSQQAGD